VNQDLERYLRCFTSYKQDDWPLKLVTAEIAYNDATHSSTGVSPFFANLGFHPKFDFFVRSTSEVPRAEMFASNLAELHQWLVAELGHARKQQKVHADSLRQPPPNFQVGDMVWLSSENIKTARPCPKLSSRRLGPFPISARINDVAFRLSLPASMRVHPVFHVSLLSPYTPNTIPKRVQQPIFVESDPSVQPHYLVTSILDSRYPRGKLQYLIEWLGYGPADRSWEPASAIITDVPSLVSAFHSSHPTSPGPALTRPSRRVTFRFPDSSVTKILPSRSSGKRSSCSGVMS
jgi:hypothetical protein